MTMTLVGDARKKEVLSACTKIDQFMLYVNAKARESEAMVWNALQVTPAHMNNEFVYTQVSAAEALKNTVAEDIRGAIAQLLVISPGMTGTTYTDDLASPTEDQITSNTEQIFKNTESIRSATRSATSENDANMCLSVAYTCLAIRDRVKKLGCHFPDIWTHRYPIAKKLDGSTVTAWVFDIDLKSDGDLTVVARNDYKAKDGSVPLNYWSVDTPAIAVGDSIRITALGGFASGASEEFRKILAWQNVNVDSTKKYHVDAVVYSLTAGEGEAPNSILTLRGLFRNPENSTDVDSAEIPQGISWTSPPMPGCNFVLRRTKRAS